MVGEENDTMKRRKQPAKKTPPKVPPLNLSGITPKSSRSYVASSMLLARLKTLAQSAARAR
jgi:hypothetical protein